jgi:hypothetical protein
MFISVRRYRNVRSVREVCAKIEATFVPMLRQSPGFVAYYAVDGGDGTMATVSIFSTERMARESNDTAAAWMREHAADLQPEPPEIVSGRAEVVARA